MLIDAGGWLAQDRWQSRLLQVTPLYIGCYENNNAFLVEGKKAYLERKN